jgi:hypothetical protein
MKGYSTNSLGPLITVHYIGYVEASRQGYTAGNLVTLITVQYIGYVEASRQGYTTWSLGPLLRSIFLAKYCPLGKAIVRGVWGP